MLFPATTGPGIALVVDVGQSMTISNSNGRRGTTTTATRDEMFLGCTEEVVACSITCGYWSSRAETVGAGTDKGMRCL